MTRRPSYPIPQNAEGEEVPQEASPSPVAPNDNATRSVQPPQASPPYVTRSVQPPQASPPYATRPVQPPQASPPYATRPVQPPQASPPYATRPVQPPQAPSPYATRPVSSPTPYAPSPALIPAPAPARRRFNLASLLLTLTLASVGLFFVALGVAIIGYVAIASKLPPVEELRSREPDFASSQIFDRNGHLLYEMMDRNAGKRTVLPISQIDRDLQLATVATEDRNFYTHVGFDPIAVARAIYYAIREKEIVSGASTITQQVARNILLQSSEQTLSRKIKEIILAAELERRYSKDEILEIYLNNNNYGNLAYGVDAAARTYFGTSASNLTLGQAAFLAGLPQAPARYDPYGGGREAALERQKVVLGLMVEAGFITPEEAEQAAQEMENYPFPPIYTERIPAPHFVFYVRRLVEDMLGPEALYTGSGLRIHTTLDSRLQAIAEEEVRNGVAALADRHVTNGALVAIEPASGHILAMVGSVDFYSDTIGGQVNVTLRCRQPGSAIKPLTYLAAFERGWTPATIVWDVPTVYTDAAGNVYKPVNYDGKFRGPTSVRTALANSLNIPAVKALDFVTVDGLLEMAERLGATSLVSPHLECPDYPYDAPPTYGLALTLGGGELKPLELVRAYATLANGGLYVESTPILWIEDNEGHILVDNRQPKTRRAVNPELVYLITHILSDTRARCLVFRCPSILELPDRPVAAKTGTTNDNRDAWTVGYTPDLAVGVWVGNNDNSPMQNVVGAGGAGPIWNAFMRRAHENIPPHPFPRPAGIVEREVCKLSGTEPSPFCPERTKEVFSLSALPPKAELDWFQEIEIDAASGLRANQFCRANVITKVMLDISRVDDPGGRRWLRQWGPEHGYEIAPDDYCTQGEQAPVVVITDPSPEAEVYGQVTLRGTVELPDFDHYELTYGVGRAPQAWGWISGPHLTQVHEDTIGTWQIPPGTSPGLYTLRVVAYNTRGAQFEARVVVRVIGPTATPTSPPTPTLLPTATPTPIPTATPTPLPTIPPLPTAKPPPTFVLPPSPTP